MNAKVKNEVNVLCGEGWDEQGDADINGGYGVACMLVYLEGTKPDLRSLSAQIGMPEEDLRIPFHRMLQSGLFSKTFNARGDRALLCSGGVDKEKRMISWRCAWGHVAAVAAGIIQRNYNDFYSRAIR